MNPTTLTTDKKAAAPTKETTAFNPATSNVFEFYAECNRLLQIIDRNIFGTPPEAPAKTEVGQ